MQEKARFSSVVAGMARRDRLHLRQEIVHALRLYFREAGFFEADVPLLLPSTCPDVTIDSVAAEDGYLTTSTEYHIKRLLVGGFERVMTLTKNFRCGDIGKHHNPEFTMLEWGRVGATLHDIETDVERCIIAAQRAIGRSTGEIVYQGYRISIHSPYERLSVKDALRLHLGVEIKEWSLPQVQVGIAGSRVQIPQLFAANLGDLVSYLLAELQPYLGCQQPVFLTDWPAFQTSSAEISPTAKDTARRSELFIAGLEIADGFPFLTDPIRQSEAFARQQAERELAGKAKVLLDENYLSALAEGLPRGAGMALGVDRLVMLLTDAPSIRDVLTFAWDER